MQQGDVKLFQTPDDGEINVNNGVIEMDGGLETSFYLSLFGGNEDIKNEWWGNISETEPEKKYRSDTQALLESIPPSSFNLKRIEDAVRKDLAWAIDIGLCQYINVSASIPMINTIYIVINSSEGSFKFKENWKMSE